MEFFTVWWYDLLLSLALVSEIAIFILDRLSLSVPRAIVTALSVLLQLSLVLGMLVVGGTLTDLLTVLMLCAATAAGLALLDLRAPAEEKDGDAKEVNEP